MFLITFKVFFFFKVFLLMTVIIFFCIDEYQTAISFKIVCTLNLKVPPRYGPPFGVMSTSNANFANCPTSGSVDESSFSKILAWPSINHNIKVLPFFNAFKTDLSISKIIIMSHGFFLPTDIFFLITGNSMCLRGRV